MANPFLPDEGSADEDMLALTIGPDAPPRLDKALAALVPEQAALSRSRLMRMIAEGAVLLDGVAVTDPKAKVAEGQIYEIRLEPAVDVETLAEDIPLTVVYEDGDLIVIDKPAGMVVHPAPGSPTGFIAAIRCRALAASVAPASSTALTRTPPACWSSPNPTVPITGWRPSSRITRSTAVIWPWCTRCHQAATPACAACAVSVSRRAAS